jgi:tRNA U38,U39,U40 pseudouridine synthase TruA
VFCQVIEQKNRNNAGVSIPAHALFLEKIVYSDTVWDKDFL